jgi:hypothetical protein
MTFEYRVAAKIKKKAESLLRFVFRYVKSSYSAQQHPAPSAKIKVKKRFAGDDHLLFLTRYSYPPFGALSTLFYEGA